MNELSKILIAYDGSVCSDAALNDLRRAGLPERIEAVVVTVAYVFLPPTESEVAGQPASRDVAAMMVQPSWAHAEKAVKKALVIAKQGASRVKALFPDWSVNAMADANSPAWAVIMLAARLQADLIILGGHAHSSAGGRLILGSVSQRVLYEAECSVRVARCSDQRREGPVRIVVGFDGLPDSDVAVDAVAARRWPKGSEVRVVTAGDALKLETHEPAVERLRAVGLTASHVSKDDSPAHALLKEAEEWSADSIFVGTRNVHGFQHLLHGSVSSAVAASAQCSVEVVRARSTVSGKI